MYSDGIDLELSLAKLVLKQCQNFVLLLCVKFNYSEEKYDLHSLFLFFSFLMKLVLNTLRFA